MLVPFLDVIVVGAFCFLAKCQWGLCHLFLCASCSVVAGAWGGGGCGDGGLQGCGTLLHVWECVASCCAGKLLGGCTSLFAGVPEVNTEPDEFLLKHRCSCYVAIPKWAAAMDSIGGSIGFMSVWFFN
jgi:hypothetical protein